MSTPQTGDQTDRGAILLVDDDDSVRITMRRVLERSGYRVLAVDGAAAAEEAWAREGTTIIALITDVMLVGVDGASLARRLREERPDLPVIVVSGYTGEAIRELGDLPPGVHFLEKPFTIDALLAVLRVVLGQGSR